MNLPSVTQSFHIFYLWKSSLIFPDQWIFLLRFSDLLVSKSHWEKIVGWLVIKICPTVSRYSKCRGHSDFLPSSVVDRGYLSRIPDPDVFQYARSRIPQQKQREGGNFFVVLLFCSHKVYKIWKYIFEEVPYGTGQIWANWQRVSFQKYWVVDLGSGKTYPG